MIKRIGVFDTETTGLVKNRLTDQKRQPEVIEFYCGVFSPKGKLIEELSTFIKPATAITPFITSLNHIDNAMVFDAPAFAGIAPEVVRIIESCDRVVAHNAAFDVDMIEIELARAGLPISWPNVICTIEQTSIIHGYRLSLTNLHLELFGSAFEEAHRAKADCAALARCYFELVKKGYIIQ